MRPLTVLSVASPFATVGFNSVGGAEQVLAMLDRALSAAGHQSFVIAGAGSHITGTLLPTLLPDRHVTDEVRQWIQQQHRQSIIRALDRFQVDLVHMHGLDFHTYLPPEGVPTLVTLHLPPNWYPPHVYHITRPRTFLHCVSSSQQRHCPPDAGLLPVIENGVPVDELQFRCTRRRYAMVLGRICPEKNFHVAMDAATRARIAVFLGGQIFASDTHIPYYHEHIQPRLDGMHRFLGPLSFARKRRLLSGARCLLWASIAPESSSLAAMESLACGTPVIAFPSGAMPDIVEHKVTGFLVHSEREMADAIGVASTIDPEVCREAARQRFSLAAMVRRYFDAYEQIVGEPRRRTGHPGADAAAATEAVEGAEGMASRVPKAGVA